MNNIEDFTSKVIGIKNKSITNEIFLLIQNDKELMHEYLRLVETEGLDNVNRQIGKIIKKSYSLINDYERNDNPSSTLIRSYQEFK